eukprot:gene3725-4646_t
MSKGTVSPSKYGSSVSFPFLSPPTASPPPGLAVSVMLRYLWERSHSKKCLWEYFLALDQATLAASSSFSNARYQPIISEEYQELKNPNSLFARHWMTRELSQEDLSFENVRLSYEHTLNYIEGERITNPSSVEKEKDKLSHSYPSSSSHDLGTGSGKELGKGSLGYYIEVTVAHIATQRAIKPAIKLGKYCYTWVRPVRSHPGPPSCPPPDVVDGSSASPPSRPNHHSGSKGGGGGVREVGDTVDYSAGGPLPLRPDCVEVVVREIMDALLYDPLTHGYRLDLLPASALPTVRQFYWMMNDQRSNGNNASSTVDSPPSPSPAALVMDYWSKDQADFIVNKAGQMWFNICSNHHGGEGAIEYLSSSPEGDVQYELKPTMRNVCRVLGLLLGSAERWNKLTDLEKFWNSHLQECDRNTNNRCLSPHTVEGVEGSASGKVPVDSQSEGGGRGGKSGKELPVTVSTSAGEQSQLQTHRREVKVKEVRQVFRAPFSDTEKIYREVGHIALTYMSHGHGHSQGPGVMLE